MVPNIGAPKTAPDPKGARPQVAPVIPMGAPILSASDINLPTRNAIFFDSETSNFIVYAGNQKKNFVLFEDAEKFAQVAPMAVPAQPAVLPAPQPQPAKPANPNAVAVNTSAPAQQAPPAGRIPNKRKPIVPADINDGIGNDPSHHESAHGLAIDG